MIERQSALISVCSRRREICGDASCHHLMGRALEAHFYFRLDLQQKFLDALGIRENAAGEDFLQKLAKMRQFLHQSLGLDTELRQAGIRLPLAGIRHHIIADAPRVEVLEIGQLCIRVFRRIHFADELRQKVKIRQMLLGYAAGIEIQIQIANAVCLHLAVKHLRTHEFLFHHWQLISLLADILHIQHRNGSQGFRAVL